MIRTPSSSRTHIDTKHLERRFEIPKVARRVGLLMHRFRVQIPPLAELIVERPVPCALNMRPAEKFSCVSFVEFHRVDEHSTAPERFAPYGVFFRICRLGIGRELVGAGAEINRPMDLFDFGRDARDVDQSRERGRDVSGCSEDAESGEQEQREQLHGSLKAALLRVEGVYNQVSCRPPSGDRDVEGKKSGDGKETGTSWREEGDVKR